jgi:hypothetical protein
MTPGEAGGKGRTINKSPARALIMMFFVSLPSGLREISYPITPGFTRGDQGVASSRPLARAIYLSNQNYRNKKKCLSLQSANERHLTFNIFNGQRFILTSSSFAQRSTP